MCFDLKRFKFSIQDFAAQKRDQQRGRKRFKESGKQQRNNAVNLL